MGELETSFAMLVGRQPNDKDRQELYRVRDALKLKANDALWSVVMMLQHYEWLYSRYPAAIAESVKEVTKTVRDTALAQARAAAAETTKASSIRLRCTRTEKCDFHRDGGDESEKCPGTCDADGCELGGYYEVGRDRVLCAAHGAIVLLARAVNQAIGADNAEDL